MSEPRLDLARVLAALRNEDYAAALVELESLLPRYPRSGRLWVVRAQIALLQEDPAGARRFALYGLALQDRAPALDLLGSACERSGDPQTAFLASAVRAELLGEDAKAAVRAGNHGWLAGLGEEALFWYAEAARRDPGQADPWTNRGFVLKALGDYQGAAAAYDEGVRRVPTDPDLRWNRAQCLLAVGRYSEGLQDAEWRWQKAVFPSKARGFAQPLWMGGYVGTLLIHAEQGFGDCLQMLRYVPLAAARVGRVVVEIQSELYRLLEMQVTGGLLPANLSLVVQGQSSLPPFDAQVPMMTLPLALGLFDLAHPPSPQPYLTCQPGIRFADGDALDRPLNVGICWRGRPTFAYNHQRSFGLAEMAPLFELPGIRWCSLQKMGGTEVADELQAIGVECIDLGSRAQDFLDTASYVKSLDLCITTDTSVAHLAGALGVETWVAVMKVPDWRWIPGGEQSVWYESVRLFRQEKSGDWSAVFARMRAALLTRLAQHRLRAAVSCKAAGNAAGAIVHYREVLALKPEQWEIWNNLGMMYHELGQLEEALAAYRTALHLRPDYVPSLNNLGGGLIKSGYPEQAVGYLQEALRLDPGYLSAASNLGIAYQNLGKADLAAACFRQVVAQEPANAEAFRNLSSLRKYREPDQEVAAMERLAADPTLSPEQRLHLSFALGKVYEDLGDFPRSFACFQEGNRLHRATYSYALAGEEAFFKRIKGVFSEQFLADRQGWSNTEASPIFILGMPRSGTSLVEQILSSHSQVFGAGELIDLAVATAACCGERGAGPYPDGVSEWVAADWRRVGEQYWQRLGQRAAGAGRITDKLPANFLRVGLIALLFPKAKVIHCRRSPVDTCLSIFKNYFSEPQPFAYSLAELGAYYRLYLELMDHWRAVLPGFMHEIIYEELVADPEERIRALVNYCGLEWEDRCLSFHQNPRAVGTASAMQVRQPLYRDSVGLASRYGELLLPLLEALAERKNG